MRRSLLYIGLILVAAAALAAPPSRPFRMGFTAWPADFTVEGVTMARDFAHAHSDVISVTFIGGIPWPESYAGLPYSANVQQELAYRPPDGKKLFVQISPLNRDRSGVAPYWGERDNMPLPAPWGAYPLDHPAIKKAYLAFVLRVIDAMHPDWLGIGVESNVLLSKNKAQWAQLKSLHAATYTAVKAKHPSLPVFFTTDVLHYLKYPVEARETDQAGEVAALMKWSDLFVMSIYPHVSAGVPRPVPPTFFDFARRFAKPIAVSESGDTSRPVELKSYGITLQGSEKAQQQFTATLLDVAERDRYRFLINFATTDFEKLCDKIPKPLDDFARIWAYCGMQTSAGKPKPALATWDSWLARPLSSP